MRLRYETGTATIIQFITLTLLNIVNAVASIISTCRHDGADCSGNILSSVIFYILTVGWFAFVAALGYAAQEKRGKRMAQLLIAAEAAVAMVALFNIKLNLHYNSGLLSLITSTLDLALAIWIITLAYRLMK